MPAPALSISRFRARRMSSHASPDRARPLDAAKSPYFSMREISGISRKLRHTKEAAFSRNMEMGLGKIAMPPRTTRMRHAAPEALILFIGSMRRRTARLDLRRRSARPPVALHDARRFHRRYILPPTAMASRRR